jgi:hypothetical protein
MSSWRDREAETQVRSREANESMARASGSPTIDERFAVVEAARANADQPLGSHAALRRASDRLATRCFVSKARADRRGARSRSGERDRSGASLVGFRRFGLGQRAGSGHEGFPFPSGRT